MTIAEAIAALNATPATARNNTQVAHSAARLRYSLNNAFAVGYGLTETAPEYIQREVEWLNAAIAAR